jgi:hypothetical protein
MILQPPLIGLQLVFVVHVEEGLANVVEQLGDVVEQFKDVFKLLFLDIEAHGPSVAWNNPLVDLNPKRHFHIHHLHHNQWNLIFSKHGLLIL